MEKVIYKLDSWPDKHVFVGSLPSTGPQFLSLQEMLKPFKVKSNPVFLVSLAGEVEYWYNHIGRPNFYHPTSGAHSIHCGFSLKCVPHMRPFTSKYTLTPSHIYEGIKFAVKGAVGVIKQDNTSYIGCPHSNGIRTAFFVFLSYLVLAPGDHDLALERTIHNCPTYKAALLRYPDVTKHYADMFEG